MNMRKIGLSLVAVWAVCSAEAVTVNVANETELVAALESWNDDTNHLDIILAEGTYDLSKIEPMHASGLLAADATSTDSRMLQICGDPNVMRDKVVIDAKSKGRVFYLNNPSAVDSWLLKNLTVLNGGNETVTTGGAVWAGKAGSFTVENCVFSNCVTKSYGGAISIPKGSVSTSSFTDTLFISNRTTTRDGESSGGGALYCYFGPTLTRCTFIGNQCASTHERGNGGAVYCGRYAKIADCCFTDNKLASGSAYFGGALYCVQGATLSGCAFTNNASNCTKGGGAIYLAMGAQAASLVTNCTFVGNYAKKGGGAGIYASGAANGSRLLKCEFSSNETAAPGGGVSGAFSMVSNCTFVGNEATRGGGISGCENVIDCVMTRNTSTVKENDGGGAANKCTLRHCWVTNNLSTFYCGGVSSCKVYDSFVAGNRGEVDGQLTGSYASHFENCEFTDGGVTCGGGSKLFVNCSFDSCVFHDINLSSLYLLGGRVFATNCLFYANNLGSGRIHASATGSDTDNTSAYVNCTFVNNVYNYFLSYVSSVPADKKAVVKNCFFFENAYKNSSGGLTFEDIGLDGTPTDSFDHSFFKTTRSVSGETNLKNTKKDPRLMGDLDPKRPYAPRHRSILNGAGDVQDWMASATDLDGHPRLTDGKVAIGAYETTEPAPGLMLRLH